MPIANDNSEDSSELNQDNKNSHVEPAPENCTVYRKNDENDFLFAGVTKKSGGKSKSAKKLKVRSYRKKKRLQGPPSQTVFFRFKILGRQK